MTDHMLDPEMREPPNLFWIVALTAVFLFILGVAFWTLNMW
jgi:hypothetical protein